MIDLLTAFQQQIKVESDSMWLPADITMSGVVESIRVDYAKFAAIPINIIISEKVRPGGG
jgi:hypothetical protein